VFIPPEQRTFVFFQFSLKKRITRRFIAFVLRIGFCSSFIVFSKNKYVDKKKQQSCFNGVFAPGQAGLLLFHYFHYFCWSFFLTLLLGYLFVLALLQRVLFSNLFWLYLLHFLFFDPTLSLEPYKESHKVFA
jgi:hypothetical protein